MPEEPAEHAPQTPNTSEPADRLVGALEVAAAVSLGVAFITGVVASAGRDWVPASDDALIALHVGDVPSHLPLVGAYSRFGWSHPGPAAYYLLALPYRLFGSTPAGLSIGASVLTFGGAFWAWLVARRINRIAGAFVVLGFTLVMLGRDGVDLRDPWNPYVGLALTGTLVVIAWATAERRAGSVFALLPLATVLVQAHVGYVPVVVAVVATAALGAARSGESTSRRPFPRRAALGGAGVAVAMWVPPLVQQFTGDPGNLWEVATSASGQGSAAGFTAATQLVFAAFTVPPSWFGGNVPLHADGIDPHWTLPVLGFVAIAAATVAVVRRDRVAVHLMLVCSAAVVGNLVAVSRITGPVHEYLFAGLGVSAAVVIALSTWVLVDALAGANLQRWCALGALGVVALGGIPLAVAQAGSDVPYPDTANAVSVIAGKLIDDTKGDRVFIEAVPEFTAYAALPGLVLALEDAGIDVVVPTDASREFGEHRTGSPRGRIRYLVAFPGMVPAYLEDGWTLVGTYEPLPAQVAEKVAALDAELKGFFEQRAAMAERGLDTSEIAREIDANRRKSYDLRAERFPIAVLRAPR